MTYTLTNYMCQTIFHTFFSINFQTFLSIHVTRMVKDMNESLFQNLDFYNIRKLCEISSRINNAKLYDPLNWQLQTISSQNHFPVYIFRLLRFDSVCSRGKRKKKKFVLTLLLLPFTCDNVTCIRSRS